jgi:hypothetical protein
MRSFSELIYFKRTNVKEKNARMNIAERYCSIMSTPVERMNNLIEDEEFDDDEFSRFIGLDNGDSK